MNDLCSICMQSDGKLFEGMHTLYCDACVELKRASWGTISEILPGLYISGMREAATFTKCSRLCVHEDKPIYDGGMHFPILTKKPNSFKDRTGARASLDALHRISDIIDQNINLSDGILVHCVGGVERSPLVVAWYLVKTGKSKNLDEAYAFLKTKRPVISDRQFWLPVKWSNL